MNSATKVGEIFTAAGQAFSRLGDLTMQLDPNSDSPSGKWTEEEINMLYDSITRFSEDLHKISASLKNRTVSQIRQALKKKAFEDAGIPAKQVPVQQVQHVIQTVQQVAVPQTQLATVVTSPQQQQQQQQQQPTTLIKQQLQALQQQQQQQKQNAIATTSTGHQSHQTVHIQHVQHIIPAATVQQQHMSSNATATTLQSLQTSPKQIIIQQANTNVNVASPQQSQPQVVHLHPQQLQQIIHTQPQTTTVTLAQFQQMQQQKLAAVAAANATTPTTVTLMQPVTVNANNLQHNNSVNSNNINSNVSATVAVHDNNVIQLQQQQQPASIVATPVVATTAPATIVPATAKGAAVPIIVAASTVAPAVVSANTPNTVVSLVGAATSSQSSTSTALKTGPDVTMTLNRINAQEHEVDVEECLPADVVKLDFVGEEVAG